MLEHTHKTLLTIGIALLTFLLTVGIFALGFVAGVKLTEKRAIFSAHQEFLPFPPEMLGGGEEMRGKNGGGAQGGNHRFAVNGTVQSVSSGALLLLEGSTVRKVDITPMTRVRDGKTPMMIPDITSGMRVNVLGRQTPEHDFEAMMVMIRK